MNNWIQYILGLDLGTNSIGWALVEVDHLHHIVRIMMMGSRIIPMDPSEIAKFENGSHLDSAASVRREAKQVRRMNERFILRRDRLNYVLNLFSMLPEHYRIEIEFETPDGLRSGKFKKGKEPKIAYKLNADKHKDGQRDKYDFIFNDRYQEMKDELLHLNPLLYNTPIPKDWTLYYLRKKALTEEISLEELSWVLHSFNKKRGYEKVEGTEEQKADSEIRTCSVTNISRLDENTSIIELTDKDNPSWHFSYQEISSRQLSAMGRFKQVEITYAYNEDGEQIDDRTKYVIKDIVTLTIVGIQQEKKYKIALDNGWEWETNKDFSSGTPLTFICTEEYKYDGTLKNRSLALVETKDKKVNWAYIKLDTETKIAQYNREHGTKGVASYIFDNLLSHKPDRLHTKIIGNLVESVDRRYYREEVMAILTEQAKYHNGFKEHYQEAVEKLYPHNESHRNVLLQQSFAQLVTDDILLYQRDLKSKKSEINDCKFEVYKYSKDGKEVVRPVKAAHTFNPYSQEFRIWKFINQLRIYEEPNDEHASRVDVTEQYLTKNFENRARLFEEFQKHKTITDSVFKKLNLPNKGVSYTWGYGHEHKEKGNETRYGFMCRLRKVKGLNWKHFLDAKHYDKEKSVTNEYMLWHFFYSVKKKSQRTQGLPKLVKRLLIYANMPITFRDEIVKQFSTFSSFPNHYGAYSEKALLKLLPLMRCGNDYWKEEEVAEVAKKTGMKKDKLQGLMENGSAERSGAVEIVYEIKPEYWQTPDDIRQYLKKEFKTNSLKNPVAEKVVRETLQVVHDIWKSNLEVNANFKFDEIHIELGRELQHSPNQKEADVEKIKANQLANHRAELVLQELGLNNKSPFLREKYRIYEDCITSAIRFDKKETNYNFKDEQGTIQQIKKEEILNWQNKIDLFKKNIKTYMLWLDERFSSPYTGIPIKLKDVFDREKYEREHTFPHERITLNSRQNLFMCETAVNKAKGAMTGMKFIKDYGGKKVKGLQILTGTQYREWIDKNVHDSLRREILLSEEIPDRFINSQLNNTCYISRIAKTLLERIVRTESEQSNSGSGIVTVNGSVTATLRRDWQLGEVWNELIAPRFIRMNQEIEKLTGTPSRLFGEEREINGQKVFVPDVPAHLRDGFEKKRIDHRHHAMDALVVALTQRGHIQYLNNVAGGKNTQDAFEARKNLKETYIFKKQINKEIKESRFRPPMQYKKDGKVITYKYSYMRQDGRCITSSTFDKVVLEALRDTLVTFKANDQIMSPRKNLYLHWDEKNGRIMPTSEKGLKEERKWCFRQEITPTKTLYGLRTIDGENYLQTKWTHTLESFASLDLKKATETINNIPDKTIRDILSKYLSECGNDPAKAFTPDGIAYMNANIRKYTTNGKDHMPIYKVSLLKTTEKGHPLSPNGGVKSLQYADTTTNVKCYFYPDRMLVDTTDMMVSGKKIPEGHCFTLVPNELVYVPTDTEIIKAKKISMKKEISAEEIGIKVLDPSRLFKVESFSTKSGNNDQLLISPSTDAQMILSQAIDYNGQPTKPNENKNHIKGEYSLKSDRGHFSRIPNTNKQVRDYCWKVVLDRLGKIKHLITRDGLVIKN